MTTLLIFAYLMLIGFLIIYIPVQVYLRTKNKKDVKRTTYSYKSVWVNFFKYLPYVLAIACLIFVLTNDVETTLTLAVFIFSCYMAGFLKIMLLEYQRKRAGGKEKKWDDA